MVDPLSRGVETSQLNGAGEKRRREGGDGPLNPRSKRREYTTIACNECKRRKVKCNGLKPCERCNSLSLDCIFARKCCSSSSEASQDLIQMRDQIASLQNQINDLRHGRSGHDLIPTDQTCIHDTSQSVPTSILGSQTSVLAVSPGVSEGSVPQFHGPSSSIYGFNIAKSTLQTMGITPESTHQLLPEQRSQSVPTTPFSALFPSDDPLWVVDRADALRLCKVYDEEIGTMYPHIDMDKVSRDVNLVFICRFTSLSLPAGSGQLSFSGADALDSEDATIMKMVLAIALLLEGSGSSELSERLFHSVKGSINSNIMKALSIKSLTLFILTASFYFQKDEEAQAWRFIGIAARSCVEMGLHRKGSLLKSFPNKTEYLEAVRNFWVVYALDRRFSVGTGLPFVLQDQDLDPSLPKPDDAFPYLKHITEFNHIAGKVWYENIGYESSAKITRNSIAFLDFQVLQWYSELPESLIFNKDLLIEQEVPGRGVRRLRFLMYLRKNSARMTIYRPVLYSATSIKENKKFAQNAVNIAKDTISTISAVNLMSDLYRTQQVCYNYFLVQALAVIFLAVVHSPLEFCDQTRDEFCAVVDLISGFNPHSYVAKRLWRTILVLRDMGSKIGLLAREDSTLGQGVHANANTVAVAGLTSHQLSSPSFIGQEYVAYGLAYSPEDSHRMSTELTNLFELVQGCGGLDVAAPDEGHTYAGLHGEDASNGFGSGDGTSALFGNPQEFSRIMGELF